MSIGPHAVEWFGLKFSNLGISYRTALVTTAGQRISIFIRAKAIVMTSMSLEEQDDCTAILLARVLQGT